jgi:hypothetical protein
MPGTRGSRARALRLRRKAWRARLKASPGQPRHRPWYAPWRLLPGGRPALRHQLARRFRTWRWRHGMAAPRNRQGRPLGWRQRIARRWHLWRGHPGSGTILLGTRRYGRRQRLRAWLRRRRQQPPRPMPAWTGPAGQRVNHIRTYRWMRKDPPAAQPQPRRRAPAPPAQQTGNGTGPAGAGTTARGGTMDTGAMADQIREMSGQDFADPEDVHRTVAGYHELIAAMQEATHQTAEKLSETGVHPAYVQAMEEAAQHLNGIAEELEQVTAGGVMQGPG